MEQQTAPEVAHSATSVQAVYSSLSPSVLTEKCSKSAPADNKKQEHVQRGGHGKRVCCKFGWDSSKNLRFQRECLFGPEFVVHNPELSLEADYDRLLEDR